jgi:RNA-directed DNA polymerase
MGNSTNFRDYIRQALYRFLWKWCKRKHPKWGKIRIANFYFKYKSADDKTIKYKNRTWVFYGKSNLESRFKKGKQMIYLQDPSNAAQILAGKTFIIPKSINSIHAFHPDKFKLIEFQIKLALQNKGRYSTLKDTLLKRQKYLCNVCHKIITTEQINESNVHVHHITPISKGGNKSSLKNMVALHSWCHQKLDHK